jgi:secondary thiamine-phosphate synthase enzyme
VSSFTCRTNEDIGILDVTDAVNSELGNAADGLALVYVKHTTAALLNCADEPLLRDDVLRVARGLLAEFRPFKHVQHDMANGEAHVLSALAGTQLVVPVVDGQLDLGRWQRILLLELDGPQTRTVHVQPLSLKERVVA